MIESDIEKYLVSQIKKIGGLAWKLTSPSTSGVPDRLIIWHGQIRFVELKRPNGNMRKLQQYRRAELNKQGIDVICLDSKRAVDNFVERIKESSGDGIHTT